ncbi:ABC transporter ATP-binding protein/permease [Methylobacterium sp. JK268]
MSWLSAALSAVVALAATVAVRQADPDLALVAGALALAAVGAALSRRVSTFLRVPIGLFGWEAVLAGLARSLVPCGLWPAGLPAPEVPVPIVVTLAGFVVLFRAAALVPAIARAMAIADIYLDGTRRLTATLPGGRPILRMREAALARLLAGGVILLGQLVVVFELRFVLVFSDLSDALQAYDAERYWPAVIGLPLSIGPYFAASALQDVLMRLLGIRWRSDLSAHYARRWIGTPAHYRMVLTRSDTDNPDQRIQEDLAAFIGGEGDRYGVYTFMVALVSQLNSFLTYAVVLWTLSARVDFGLPFAIPGLLLWLAIAYSGLFTAVTAAIGRRLVPLSFARQHLEADYRYALARLREHGEQVALMGGGPAEVAILGRLFRPIRHNAYRIAAIHGLLGMISKTTTVLSDRSHYFILGAFYFRHEVTLGDMVQMGAAFASVAECLTFASRSFPALAELRSVLDRLISFDDALARADAPARGERAEGPAGSGIALDDLTIRLPDGRALSAPLTLRFRPGESVLVTGPSGSGKTTLLRVLAGIWPFWTGRVAVPAGARLLTLPQKPYLPVGTLRAALAYPHPEPGPRETAAEALAAVGLAHLIPSLDADEGWAQRLSGGEQQRLAAARALLARPDWLLVDEATSALDAAAEAQVYGALIRMLPETTIISIGHRESLAAFHTRRLRAGIDDDGRLALDASPAAEAERAHRLGPHPSGRVAALAAEAASP